MARSITEGRELFLKLMKVTDRFLSVSLDYMGAIPLDECVHKAVKQQRAVIEAYPRSRAALAFKKLATVTNKWAVPKEASGQLQFFVERLIQASYMRREVQ
jgi:flagellar biosynthesis protein FlhG